MATTIEQLYIDTLGREADPGGLAYWKQQFGDTVEGTEADTFKSVAKNEVIAELGLNSSIENMKTAGIPESEINTYIDQAMTQNAQFKVAQLNADKQFSAAQAELDAMSQKEMEMIKQQQQEFESAQQQLAAQAAEQMAAARAEQERLAAEAAAYQKQAEEKAAQLKAESETFQRTTAERDVARKRAGRSTIARPLLSGAAVGATAPTLGVGGGMSSTGSLGTTGTLGVG